MVVVGVPPRHPPSTPSPFIPLCPCPHVSPASSVTQVARYHDPRLSSDLLAHKAAGISADDGLKYHVKELLIGAEIAGQYRLDAYISSGTYGHGWRALDLQSGQMVCACACVRDVGGEPNAGMWRLG